MENNLILSKESSEKEIKRYFNAVLELSKSDNEFPISLDEVWMLVYGRKEEAVRTLTLSEQFIENVDYQVFRKNAENPNGGRPTKEYKLTVSCMEFFIARKVRPVFEVYRQVFHKVAKHELSRKELALMVLQSEEEKERLALEVQQQQITIELQEKEIKQAAPKINYYDNHLQSVNTLTSTQVAKQIGMDAEKLHKKLKQVGIIYKQSGQWLLHAPYSTWGLHSTRTQTYTRSDGSTGTSIYTVWTIKGVRFIIALYENEWDVKKAIKQIKSEVNPAA
jgi:phage antirepressor YoqD-like protein